VECWSRIAKALHEFRPSPRGIVSIGEYGFAMLGPVSWLAVVLACSCLPVPYIRYSGGLNRRVGPTVAGAAPDYTPVILAAVTGLPVSSFRKKYGRTPKALNHNRFPALVGTKKILTMDNLEKNYCDFPQS
jgi:hypothetical protein